MIRERTKRSNDEEKSHTAHDIKFPSCFGGVLFGKIEG
jgi:hypothetical protein